MKTRSIAPQTCHRLQVSVGRGVKKDQLLLAGVSAVYFLFAALLGH